MTIGEYLESVGQKPVSCHLGDTAQDVATKLREKGIGAMPVVSVDGALVGMVSERDLVASFSRLGAEIVNAKISDILSKHVIFMGPEADFSDAMETMNAHGFRHIPILSNGKLVGVVSIRDVLAVSIPHEGEIGKHPVLAVTK